jgi:hypothetical protein
MNKLTKLTMVAVIAGAFSLSASAQTADTTLKSNNKLLTTVDSNAALTIESAESPAIDATSVPESSSLILMSLALIGFGISLRKNKIK